jgi:hypothetical protein
MSNLNTHLRIDSLSSTSLLANGNVGVAASLEHHLPLLFVHMRLRCKAGVWRPTQSCCWALGARPQAAAERWVGSVTKPNTSVSAGWLPAARSVASRARSRPHVASPARDVGGGRRAARRPSWRATRTGALGGGQTLQPANHRAERLQTRWDKMAAAPRQPRPNRGAVTFLARERRPHFLA